MLIRGQYGRRSDSRRRNTSPPKYRFSRRHGSHPEAQTEEEAAVKIQALWRGCIERQEAKKRKVRHRPPGFYTHSLGLTHGFTQQLPEDKASRREMFLLLEDPNSSQAAQVVSGVLVFTILVSIVGFITETEQTIYRAAPRAWLALDVVCTVIFTLEYCARLVVCEEGGLTILRFVFSPMNFFDLVAILPLYIEVMISLAGYHDGSGLQELRLLRLSRAVRIFKLGRYASGMRLMCEALMSSTQALSVLVFLLCMGVVLFSSALYHAERLSCPDRENMSASEVDAYESECADGFNRGTSPSFGLCCTEDNAPNSFPSAVAAFWWSMVTMTSVGYGDVWPRTAQGKIVGAFTTLVGMILIALPVAIVGQKFQDAYETMDMEEIKNRAAARLKVSGEVCSLVPSSDICEKLQQLRIKDPAFAGRVVGFTACLQEVWENRERLGRENQCKLRKHEELKSQMGTLMATMQASVVEAPL